MSSPTASASKHSPAWKWWICGLLLLASAINYMDRQTLANAAVRITKQFSLTQEQYGTLELGFGWAFAVGSIFFGIIADKYSIRWVYPIVLLLWSGAGFATGLANSYDGLLICRTLLGFFEAGHWPCGVKATQRLLEPKDRSMGNSVLQSGTSIGAIITPLIMRFMLTEDPSSWRFCFQAIGAIGIFWVVLWLAFVRKGDLDAAPPSELTAPKGAVDAQDTIWRALLSRQMFVVLIVIALINTSWQLVRAWLPKFLIEGRGFPESEMLYFNSLFYVATDVGCIGAGLLTLWLCRRGLTVNGARKLAFFACASLSALTLCVPLLPRGWLLLGVLLLVGAGLLGVFPVYHAFTQDISARHQGKITGVAGVAAWALSPTQKLYGRLIDRTGSFDLGLALAGCMPLLAFLALWLFWEKRQSAANPPGN